MFSLHRNSYLQQRCSYINPRIINRCIDLARDQPTVDPHETELPFFRLESEQPYHPVENADLTRRPCAFGRWALPKLRRELHDKDPTVVIQALASISDLIHDPEKGFEAIRLKIPARMRDLLTNNWVSIREQTAITLTIIAGLLDGKEAIVKDKELMVNVAVAVKDSEEAVRINIAECLNRIAGTWMTADCLVELDFIELLIEVVLEEKEEIAIIHLETLFFLMYNDGKHRALNDETFKNFLKLLNHDNPKIITKALDCLMLLTSTKQGKKLAIEYKLLETLNRLLHRDNLEICESTAAVLMLCTVKTRAKILAATVADLTHRLIQLTKNPENQTLQMYAVQVLTNICEHPLVRQEVQEKWCAQLNEIKSKFNPVYKETLLKVLNWLPQYAN